MDILSTQQKSVRIDLVVQSYRIINFISNFPSKNLVYNINLFIFAHPYQDGYIFYEYSLYYKPNYKSNNGNDTIK